MRVVHPFTPLKRGDRVGVVAPTGGGDLLSQETIAIASRALHEMGLECVFYPMTFVPLARTIEDKQRRAADINAAFADPDIGGLLTVLGGYSGVHILSLLDYACIASSKKLLCGYSDATALNSALLARAGLMSLSGPHFSTFGMARGNEYTLSAFKQMAFRMSRGNVLIQSAEWSNDLWFLDQENRTFRPNLGPVILQEGSARGTLIGGNLSTQTLLSGTSYLYQCNNDIILFVEDDQESHLDVFDRMLFNLTEAVGSRNVKAILIGRFEDNSNVDLDELKAILSYRTQFAHIPIIANMDFGHTMPMLSLPYGGQAEVHAEGTHIEFACDLLDA